MYVYIGRACLTMYFAAYYTKFWKRSVQHGHIWFMWRVMYARSQLSSAYFDDNQTSTKDIEGCYITVSNSLYSISLVVGMSFVYIQAYLPFFILSSESCSSVWLVKNQWRWLAEITMLYSFEFSLQSELFLTQCMDKKKRLMKKYDAHQSVRCYTTYV